MLIYLDIKIPHLQIAHQGGNLEVGNIKIHLIFTTVSTISMPRIGWVSWNWYFVDPNTDEQEIRKRPKEQKIKTYPSFDVLLL